MNYSNFWNFLKITEISAFFTSMGLVSIHILLLSMTDIFEISPKFPWNYQIFHFLYCIPKLIWRQICRKSFSLQNCYIWNLNRRQLTELHDVATLSISVIKRLLLFFLSILNKENTFIDFKTVYYTDFSAFYREWISISYIRFIF
jgi:hypothetical protein